MTTAASGTLDDSQVRIEGLVKSFGDRLVLDSFSVAIAPGERVGLIGPNGSGKTTLLRCIAGSVIPEEGRIDIFGNPAGSSAAKKDVGISLAQDRSFYMRLTAHQNLLFFARLRLSKRAASERVAAIEGELQLEDIAPRPMHACSTGMVQRVALARSLLGDPRVLLLDEATRSLDERSTERLWAALGARPDMAVVLATHIHDDVSHLGRTVELS